LGLSGRRLAVQLAAAPCTTPYMYYGSKGGCDLALTTGDRTRGRGWRSGFGNNRHSSKGMCRVPWRIDQTTLRSTYQTSWPGAHHQRALESVFPSDRSPIEPPLPASDKSIPYLTSYIRKKRLVSITRGAAAPMGWATQGSIDQPHPERWSPKSQIESQAISRSGWFATSTSHCVGRSTCGKDVTMHLGRSKRERWISYSKPQL